MAPLIGFKPMTFSLGKRYSISLNYRGEKPHSSGATKIELATGLDEIIAR